MGMIKLPGRGRARTSRWCSSGRSAAYSEFLGAWRVGLAGLLVLGACSDDPVTPPPDALATTGETVATAGATTTTGSANATTGGSATTTGGSATTTGGAATTTSGTNGAAETTGGGLTAGAPTTGGSTNGAPTSGTTGGTATGSVGSDGGSDVDGGGIDVDADGGTQSTGEPASRPPATTLSFPIAERELVEDEPRFNVHRPADLSEPGFKLPVVAWANGGCLRSDFIWAPMFERWASAGFVVLSLTGGSGDPDDLLGMALASGTDKTHHGALIDWVVAQNESGPYAGMLDLDRIIVAGNSCGGVTALELAAEDERVAGIFVLSGSSAVGSTNQEVMANIKVPLGFVVGNLEEDIAGANAVGDYEALGEGIAGMVVNRFEGDHVTVSMDEVIQPEVTEIALNWMDLVLYGTQEAYDALNSDKVCDSCTDGWWTLTAKNLESLLR